MPVCNDCGGTVIEYDTAAGNGFCVKCGTVVEENTIVNEVAFGETSNGAAIVQGSFVGQGATHARMSGPYGNRGNNESREQTIANATKKIQSIANVLRLSDIVCLAATRMYTLAVEHKFTKGRKSLNVVAVCLYVACRQKETRNYMLIDFSDLLQVNVFELGHTYLQLVQTLNLRLPLVDPSHYISRFAALLEFGDETHKVATDAVRLVQRFDRDWMTRGRRPAGICGAALLLAARMNNFRRSVEEIVQVVKIADTTLKKRLDEFKNTPSGSLTLADFRNVWLEEEMDPPAFTKGKERDEAERLALEGKLDGDADESDAKGKGKKKGTKKKKKRKRGEDSNDEGENQDDPIQPPPIQSAVDPTLLNQGILRGTVQHVPLFMPDPDLDDPAFIIDPVLLESPSNLTSFPHTGSEPLQGPPASPTLVAPLTSEVDETASTVLAEEVATFLNNTQGVMLSGALDEADERRLAQITVDDELVGLDEEELDRFLLSEAEVKIKERVWVELNKDYLEAIAAKGEQQESGASNKSRKRRKTHNKPRDATTPHGNTAAESVRNLLKKNPKYSKRINYDALKDLFVDGGGPPSVASRMGISDEKDDTVLYTFGDEKEDGNMVIIEEEVAVTPAPSALPGKIPIDELGDDADAEGEADVDEGSDYGAVDGGWEDASQPDISLGTDLLGTPGAEGRSWSDVPETPVATRVRRPTRASIAGTKAPLTLRDQEKHIDNLKKENFSVKLRVHFLEDQLAKLAPDQMEAVLKQNINLKIEVQQRGVELKKLKKLVLELERELDRFQRGGGSKTRERELEEKLEERDRELNEWRRGSAKDADDDMFRELEAHNAELQERNDNAKAIIEENLEEIERLKDIIDRRGDASLGESSGGEGRRERLKRRAEELEAENEELHARLGEHAEIIGQKEDEKEDLQDEINALRLEIEDIQRKREAESYERSESRAQVLEEREEREAVEEDLNTVRDKLAAVMIELQQREDELDMKTREIDELVAEHQRIIEVVDNEWRGEIEEVRTQVEELRDVLAERESECKDLRLTVSEHEGISADLRNKFEAALAQLEEEGDQKEGEIDALNNAVEKLSGQLDQMEDEAERFREETDRLREDDLVERERLEALVAALKEELTSLQKAASVKVELQETTDMYEVCKNEIHAHRSRQEELARHVEDLVEEARRERSARERLEAELEAADKEHDTEVRRQRRTLEAKESALQSALNDLARVQSLLTQRESDLQAVQTALQTLEAESKRLGETHTTARFSLQLETDRLKRDLERVEDELARARKELDDKESRNRDRDGTLDKLHAEKRELESQLASQAQARLNISEKLDTVQAALRSAEGDIATYKTKVAELEQRLSKDQRSLLSAESQYRDQLTERNTLLLTIYQYLDKILGVDKTPKKGSQAETKPFTNFGIFHDNLITRLKTLSQIQADFEKRCKEAEGRFSEKLNDIRKQLDHRWKQIDKFEASVKTYAEAKTTWRRKLAAKEGELEAIKLAPDHDWQTSNTDMALQLANIKRPGQTTDAMEVRSLSARAANAERRLNNAQNQLLATEEKVASMNQRNAAADAKWEVRVKEYELRLKAAEERVKRERQGGKERVGELENNLKSLQRQLEIAHKRNQQLAEVIDSNKTSSGSATPK
ncbi:hypothetical protein H0H93_010792 [Arthromyces matolae]|nr:hypothetical protein H0H93_010792 [Arthromyces matolae]